MSRLLPPQFETYGKTFSGRTHCRSYRYLTTRNPSEPRLGRSARTEGLEPGLVLPFGEAARQKGWRRWRQRYPVDLFVTAGTEGAGWEGTGIGGEGMSWLRAWSKGGAL